MNRNQALKKMSDAYKELFPKLIVDFNNAGVDMKTMQEQRETVIKRILGGVDPVTAVEDSARHAIFMSTKFGGSVQEHPDQSAALGDALRDVTSGAIDPKTLFNNTPDGTVKGFESQSSALASALRALG